MNFVTVFYEKLAAMADSKTLLAAPLSASDIRLVLIIKAYLPYITLGQAFTILDAVDIGCKKEIRIPSG